MQGYILNYNKTRDEDLIVSILTKNEKKTLYRFYGARHSSIHLGYKIDFEEEVNGTISINRLRNIMHLSYRWNFDKNKLYYWQAFIKILNKHLTEVKELDDFYFDIIDKASSKLETQDAKRVLVESYLYILEHEGRLHLDNNCFICDMPIVENKIILVRGFLKAHKFCLPKQEFIKQEMELFFRQKNGFHLNNETIEKLWLIVLEGI